MALCGEDQAVGGALQFGKGGQNWSGGPLCPIPSLLELTTTSGIASLFCNDLFKCQCHSHSLGRGLAMRVGRQ